jgi:hypothetical protein
MGPRRRGTSWRDSSRPRRRPCPRTRRIALDDRAEPRPGDGLDAPSARPPLLGTPFDDGWQRVLGGRSSHGLPGVDQANAPGRGLVVVAYDVPIGVMRGPGARLHGVAWGDARGRLCRLLRCAPMAREGGGGPAAGTDAGSRRVTQVRASDGRGCDRPHAPHHGTEPRTRGAAWSA